MIYCKSLPESEKSFGIDLSTFWEGPDTRSISARFLHIQLHTV